jgi:hypothetical protein
MASRLWDVLPVTVGLYLVAVGGVFAIASFGLIEIGSAGLIEAAVGLALIALGVLAVLAWVRVRRFSRRLQRAFGHVHSGDEWSVEDSGFDVAAEANASNPIGDLRVALAEGGLEDSDRIAGVGRERSLLLRVRENAPFATEPEAELDFCRLAEVDDDFLDLAALPLASRGAGYVTDADVMEALRSDPGVAIADDLFLGTDGFGTDDDLFGLSGELADAIRNGEPFQPVLITVIDRETGNELNLRVIGFMEAQVSGILPQLSGIFVHDAGIDALSADGRIPETFFLTAAGQPSDEELEVLADDVESALLERGVQASSIQEPIDDQARASTQSSCSSKASWASGWSLASRRSA